MEQHPEPYTALSNTPEDPTSRSAILGRLTPEEWEAVQALIIERRAKTYPKLIDIRFVVDLVVTRFYLVLMVGKDRRNKSRNHRVGKLTRVGNIFAAVLLLLGTNLIISLTFFLVIYLLKSALGIDLFAGHISQTLEYWLK
ncbi:MAG: hypothetical protein WCD18_19570 [Thermosynechococcaceae cyanobacterium]